MDAILAAIRDYDENVALLRLPGPRAYVLSTTADGEHRAYDYTDINDLALGYVVPHVEPIDSLWDAYEDVIRDEELADAVYAYLPRVAHLVWAAYVRVRGKLMASRRAHVTMTPAQRVSVMALFAATVRVRVMMARLGRLLKGLPPNGMRYTSAFVYVTAVRDHAKLAIDIPEVRVRDLTLEQLRAAFENLTTALETCGAALPHAQAYWLALWDRFAVITSHVDVDVGMGEGDEEEEEGMDLEQAAPDGEAQEAMRRALAYWGMESAEVPAAPRPEVRVGEDLFDATSATEKAGVRNDVAEKYVAEPLPIGGNGRRLRLHFLALMEARYFAYEQRFHVLRTFEEACATKLARRTARAYRELLVRAPDCMAKIFAWAMATGSNVMHRVMHETIWRDLCAVHLGADDVARYVLLTIESTTRSTASDVVSDHPHPDDVLSRVRMPSFTSVNRYVDNEKQRPFHTIVQSEFFPHERDRAEEHAASRAAIPSERLSILVLACLLGAILEQHHVRAEDTPSRNAYLDELEHKHGHGVLPFATPEDMLADTKRTPTGTAIFRLLRRTFVLKKMPGGDVPLVLEVPTFSSALLLWVAWSGVAVDAFPSDVRHYVHALRQGPS